MRPPPACYLLAAVAVLADPDLNLATVIKCETARVRGATVVVPPARSTLAVTNTCPKDEVHLCWHNENERIYTYRRRRRAQPPQKNCGIPRGSRLAGGAKLAKLIEVRIAERASIA